MTLSHYFMVKSQPQMPSILEAPPPFLTHYIREFQGDSALPFSLITASPPFYPQKPHLFLEKIFSKSMHLTYISTQRTCLCRDPGIFSSICLLCFFYCFLLESHYRKEFNNPKLGKLTNGSEVLQPEVFCPQSK